MLARLTFTLIQPITTVVKQRTEDTRWYAQRYVVKRMVPVLELAVGTGRIALKAVRQGAEVVGLDLSPTMLAKAAERRDALPKAKAKNLHLAQADMRHFELDAQFDLITCPFNAFSICILRMTSRRVWRPCGHHCDQAVVSFLMF